MSLPATISRTARERIQAAADNLRDALTARQETYRARRGRFWQGRTSSTLVPVDGLDVPQDRTAERAGSNDRSWADHALPLALPIQVECHEYLSPRGPGWVLIARARHAGRTYEAAHATGPEGEQRRHGWRAAEEVPLG